MEQLMRAHEVAKMLGISKTSLLRWIRQGEGPEHLSTPGRLFLFDKNDVLAWIKNMKSQQKGTPAQAD